MKTPIKNNKAKFSNTLQAFILTISLSPFLLTACHKAPELVHNDENQSEDDHNSHKDNKNDKEHKNHKSDEHSHSYDEHPEVEHKEGEHENDINNGHDHKHDHSHEEHAIKEQKIPADYQVNFAVSNYPMYLLSEAVTKGTKTTVYRLLGAGDVGHHGSLSPSDAKTIKESKYVVWFGQELESNLTKSLSKADNVLTILDNQNINRLEQRNERADVIKGQLDPHIWLDPENAKVIVKNLAELHATAKPELRDVYKQNTESFIKDLDTLVGKYQNRTVKKYWSSHDAFQYLEKPLNIELAGTLTTDHEIPAKASQIMWLIKNRPYNNMCLLSQNAQKEGITEKLQPVINKVLVEDMSNSDNFLDAWDKSASSVVACLEAK